MIYLKRSIYALWLIGILLLLVLFIKNPDSFSPSSLAEFFARYQNQALLVYILICLFRGLFLIPSTPFIIAGVLLFPQIPWKIFIISLAGVAAGSTMVYYFSDLLGFSEKLERKYPKQLEKWHRRLNSPKSSLIVIAWSFFPLVPTDLICYVAGIVKMPYRYLIAGVLIGETILIYCYVFMGKGLFDYFLS